ncbi:hypothetical protein [Pseudanabaena sp. FACHB-2040]|uniref:hypothetical protein n=1 Tax=Pseudanabaena sp. FACHB-2040 TaxID=2692859 RepID=UPI001686E5E2|nr:hypothetical protein [Pseudanabaena sp. FACHB-2040]MBD2260874.1 hypothetical protein [Pseudanabaena sp. FACHB-2040]
MGLVSRLLLLCLPLGLLVACDGTPTGQEVPETPAPATTQESDTSVVPQVTFGDISFTNTLPGTVAEGQTIAATSPDPSTPPGDETPEHILFEFQPYYPEVFQENPGFTLPQIAVYPRDQFATYGFEEEAATLEDILASQPDLETLETLPYLPEVEGDQLFHAAPTYLEFEGGTGIRYITAYGLDVSPLTTERVFYTFQGLTEDGRYISAVFPIETGLFTDAATLEGAEYNAFAARYEEYLAETRDRIATANPETGFTPPLTQLDALIESIQVNSP